MGRTWRGRLKGMATLAIGVAWGGPASAQSMSTEPSVIFSPTGQAVMVDPLAAQMMAGTGVPLTRGQAGLSAAAMASRMTGIGTGRASGVRGTAEPRGSLNVRELAAKRPTLGTPGGQASNYFNRYGRGTSVNVSSPASRATTGKYYNRPQGFFPEGRR